jgi:hypothetical protein
MIRRLGRLLLFAVSGFVIASLLLVALYREVPPPVTPLMLIRRVEGYPIGKSWRPLDAISSHLIEAVIAGEDAKFCQHHGFDWDAISEAWRRYRQGTGRLRGASTISMQTAKNVFLWPGRDWIRKAFEAYFTALIELAWGKARIIEIYPERHRMGARHLRRGGRGTVLFSQDRRRIERRGSGPAGGDPAGPPEMVGEPARPLCCRAGRLHPRPDARPAARHAGVPRVEGTVTGSCLPGASRDGTLIESCRSRHQLRPPRRRGARDRHSRRRPRSRP